MARMIGHPSEVFDERGDPRQRPQLGLVTPLDRSLEQRANDLVNLSFRNPDFRTGRSFAGQREFAGSASSITSKRFTIPNGSTAPWATDPLWNLKTSSLKLKTTNRSEAHSTVS